ncbi:MAG: hypothetical protein OEW00_04215 [candidate division Zixibacteria bacterium]|nr:hypothetical protein [candidate division Zixibacteria bacterium]
MINLLKRYLVYSVVFGGLLLPLCPCNGQVTNHKHPVCDYLGPPPPGDEPIVFAPGIVSTEADQYRLVVSPTKQDIFYCEGPHLYHIARKADGSGWHDPVIAPFSEDIDGEACFSADGSKLYFCSRRPFPGAKVPMNLWVSEKVNGTWGKATHFEGPVNDQTVHTPSVTANGNLYASGLIRFKFVDGTYQAAEKLSPDIKGTHPFVAPDESYIIFGARDSGSYTFKLRITFRKPDGTWTPGRELNDKINSTGTEGAATVTPDGLYMFFTRQHDIYWVKGEFIERLRAVMVE